MAGKGLTKEVISDTGGWGRKEGIFYTDIWGDRFKQTSEWQVQRAYLFFEAEKRPMWPRKIGREEEEMRLARQQGLRRGAGQPRGLFQGPWLLLLVKGDPISGFEQWRTWTDRAILAAEMRRYCSPTRGTSIVVRKSLQQSRTKISLLCLPVLSVSFQFSFVFRMFFSHSLQVHGYINFFSGF